MRLILRSLWFWAIVAALVPMHAFGQGLQPVTEVRVEGTQRIDPETVRSYVLIKPGDTPDEERMDRSLKAIFATGLFADVTLRVEVTVLIVRVVENPIINRIAFEGNRKLNNDALNAEVQLRPRVVFTRAKVQADVKRILDVYRRTGRFAATVEPKVIQLPQNRVDLVFEIEEGAVTTVERINFVGNRRFSDNTLREGIITKESRWWRFLSSDDTYDPDRLSFDRELLRKYYLANGYADFRVVSAVAELTPNREGFYITFTLDEGERYKLGKIEITSRIRNLNVDDLRSSLRIAEGDWYNADQVEGSILAMTDAVGSQGYAFVEVRPRVTRDREAHTVSVTFEVQEGPRVYVERINIIGNVRTLDKVIRREFRLVEGDAFNSAKLRRSRQRVRNLGFFEKVDVTNAPGEQPDRTVINVEVQEKSTGELSFGVGYSTQDGALADIGIRERNLLGRGQDLKLGLTLSQKRQEIDLSFSDPYCADYEIGCGFDLFRITRDLLNEARYRQRTTGFGLRTGYLLTESLRQTLRYTFRADEIYDVADGASPFIVDQAGTTLTSMVGQELTYDRRDDRFDPTSGYFLSLGTDFAGLGADVRYIRGRVFGGVYYSLDDDYVLGLTGEVGVVKGWGGQRVRIQNRFSLGGENLRGFATGGVGPRDALTGDSLGGTKYFAGSLEMSFPTPAPKELGLKGIVFTDVGTLFDPDQTVANGVDDSKMVRVSAGVGLNWQSPFGPIRVSYGYPLLKQSFDKTEGFRFSFGSKF
jgi:outer membrane protein insertion porin family